MVVRISPNRVPTANRNESPTQTLIAACIMGILGILLTVAAPEESSARPVRALLVRVLPEWIDEDSLTRLGHFLTLLLGAMSLVGSGIAFRNYAFLVRKAETYATLREREAKLLGVDKTKAPVSHNETTRKSPFDGVNRESPIRPSSSRYKVNSSHSSPYSQPRDHVNRKNTPVSLNISSENDLGEESFIAFEKQQEEAQSVDSSMLSVSGLSSGILSRSNLSHNSSWLSTGSTPNRSMLDTSGYSHYRDRMRYHEYAFPPELEAKMAAKDGHSWFEDNDEQAARLLVRLGIQDDMGRWIDNLRRWISRRVLKPLVEILQKPSLQHSMYNVAQSQGRDIEETLRLFVLIPGFPQTEYLKRRLADLAQGTYLSSYRWNGGGDYDGKSWDSSLPTDAKIIEHVVRTYLDILLPRDFREPEGRAFTFEHFVQGEQEKEGPSDLFLRLCKGHISLTTPKEVWPVVSRRNNVFAAFVLFLVYISRHQSGFIQELPLQGSSIGLLSVIDE